MRIGSALAVIAIGGLGACGDGLDTDELEAAARVCAGGPTVPGIDVSYYQGTIDWRAVRADGVRFAFVRVSDGLTHPDSQFDRNWAEARAHGVLRGAYQFFRPARDAIAQADLLLERMGPLEPDDLPPVLDVEASDDVAPAAIIAGVRAWVEHVEARTGKRPLIYSGRNFWRTSAGGADLTEYPLWIAQWGPTCPDLPEPWEAWHFWQTSATGRVAGISGDVDVDVWNGDLASLLAFAGAGTVCGDGRCTAVEDPDTCAADCPPCGVVPIEGGTVDDDDACFTAGGPEPSLRAVDGAGWADSLVWTYTTASADEANYGDWQLHMASSGRYRVEAYTAAPYGRSRTALYKVRHAGYLDGFVVDQERVDGWQVVAEVDFAAGGAQWVHLADNTGEPRAGEVQLTLDAVRLTRLGDATMPPAPMGPGAVDDVGGEGVSIEAGCDVGGGGGAGVGVAMIGLRRRRRRRLQAG